MAEYLSPGVYVEEMIAGSHTIKGAPTSVTAFVGFFESGEINQPIEIVSFTEFQEKFGGTDCPSAASVRQFFLNGGSQCWVVRAKTETEREEIIASLLGAIRSLDSVDRFNLLCLPATAEIDPAGVIEIIAEAIKLCEERRVVLLMDSPGELTDPNDVLTWVNTNPSIRNRNTALYFPWIELAGLSGSPQMRVPPSGTVAGVIARIDANRGVWTAPAGIEADLRGVTALEVVLSDTENGLLNRSGVNCLREFGPRKVVWGARTLSTDPEWKYINVRRLDIFLEDSIEQGLQWTVFEPNDERLWGRVQQMIGNFLRAQFAAGALAGDKPEVAYFVKCDRTTMTQDDIDNGRCVVLVGFAPVKPAEFIILRFVQTTLS